MKLIPLTQGQFAKVDDEDFEKFGRERWNAYYHKQTRSFYAKRHHPRTGEGRRTIYLHREIMGRPAGKKVDHRNHDTLDNQKSNLRICSNLENCLHRKGANKNSKSGLRGVFFNKQTGKWFAQVGRSYLGLFIDKNDAARACSEFREKHFGEFMGKS